LQCDGTCAETRFRFSSKRTNPFKRAGASVQSTTASRDVRISGSNVGYTMFRSSVKSTGYPLHFASFPFTSPPVRHRVPTHFNWTPIQSAVLRSDSSTSVDGSKYGSTSARCNYSYSVLLMMDEGIIRNT